MRNDVMDEFDIRRVDLRGVDLDAIDDDGWAMVDWKEQPDLVLAVLNEDPLLRERGLAIEIGDDGTDAYHFRIIRLKDFDAGSVGGGDSATSKLMDP